ncbi:MAG: hypothetical protein K6G57_01790 [Lachnospiraceae bacterium]|nr:hypothetical protein [Lachnospiraceae bacterium]
MKKEKKVKEKKPRSFKRFLKKLVRFALVVFCILCVVHIFMFFWLDPAKKPKKRSIWDTRNFDIDFSKLPAWDVIENIDMSSVCTNDDGSITFIAKGPEGQDIRFKGWDIEVSEGKIKFGKNCSLVNLDSFGRIYSIVPQLERGGEWWDQFMVCAGYSLEKNPHLENEEDITFGTMMHYFEGLTRKNPIRSAKYLAYFSFAEMQPNFFAVGTSIPSDIDRWPNQEEMTARKLIVRYEKDDEMTGFRRIFFNPMWYQPYLEGEKYDPGREVYDPNEGIFTFSVAGLPELKHEYFPYTDQEVEDRIYECNFSYMVEFSENRVPEVLNLKDADGNILDKNNTVVREGYTASVKLSDDFVADVPFVMIDSFRGAQMMHDLVPYAYPEAKGDLKALVIPIAWKDQPENATDETLERFKTELGRVISADGTVTDYSDRMEENRFSLSEYFDIASYGELNISSYMTDWYDGGSFEKMKEDNVSMKFFDKVLKWLYKNYPDLDYESFDRDRNGYFDAVVFLNAGDNGEDGFSIIAFEGAIQYRETYGSEYVGTPDRPNINCAVNMNASHFSDNTLIHEFSHMFGLIDYYDVNYSGIDALGGYDMQDTSKGDWNAYSKYAVGWGKPQVIKDMKPGESKTIQIGAMSETGDYLIIPGAESYFDGPFCEYIMVDLFSECGTNKYDGEYMMLGGEPAVRIYHVDAAMEKRDYVSSDFPNMEPCTIGTIHYPNSYSKSGFYNIELIQAGKVNTFTNLECPEFRSWIEPQDLFKQGDKFSLDEYSDFFNNGTMDDGTDFGYEIEVVSISGSGSGAKAEIRITRQ